MWKWEQGSVYTMQAVIVCCCNFSCRKHTCNSLCLVLRARGVFKTLLRFPKVQWNPWAQPVRLSPCKPAYARKLTVAQYIFVFFPAVGGLFNSFFSWHNIPNCFPKNFIYFFSPHLFFCVCVCCTIKSLCDHWASMSVGLCKACCVCAESCLPFHDLVQLNKLRQGSLYMWRTLWCHYLVAHSRSAWWVLPGVAHCKDLKKRFCETWHYYLLFCLFMIL